MDVTYGEDMNSTTTSLDDCRNESESECASSCTARWGTGGSKQFVAKRLGVPMVLAFGAGRRQLDCRIEHLHYFVGPRGSECGCVGCCNGSGRLSRQLWQSLRRCSAEWLESATKRMLCCSNSRERAAW